jgi:hypothetical protein
MTITGWPARCFLLALVSGAAISGAEAARGDYVPLSVFACLYLALALLTTDEEIPRDRP